MRNIQFGGSKKNYDAKWHHFASQCVQLGDDMVRIGDDRPSGADVFVMVVFRPFWWQ